MQSGAKVRSHLQQTFVHTHTQGKEKRENFSATQSQQRTHQERTFGYFFCVNPLSVDGESERENSNLWNLEDLRSVKKSKSALSRKIHKKEY